MLHPGRPATLANWQQAPFNRWSFLHVDRVVPTAAIGRGGAPVAPFAVRERAVLEVPVARVSGYPGSVADVLRETDTDAFLVVNDGVIVHESYPDTVGRKSRHLLMSVTKSFVGVVAGILADRGILDLDGQITDHVREVVGFGYEGASVRNLLDMRSGIAFSEEYLNPDSEVRILEHAASWRPYQAGLPTSTYDYLSRLPADGPHGGVFRYRSCETDILGWVCERAAGVHMATLLSRSGRGSAWRTTPTSRSIRRAPRSTTAVCVPPPVMSPDSDSYCSTTGAPPPANRCCPKAGPGTCWPVPPTARTRSRP